MSPLQLLYDKLRAAGHPEDVFGELTGTVDAQWSAAEHIYRTLARIAHPDHNPAEPKLAHDTFIQLKRWLDTAKLKIQSKIYGNRKVTTITTELKSSKHHYREVIQDHQGEIYDYYRARADDRTVVLIMAARHPRDNDLVLNEIKIRMKLATVEPRLGPYLHKLYDSFVMGKAKRQVMVLEYIDGLHSLEGVVDNYPEGLDPRDMAWMMNRVWEALWFTHMAGFVNGAILPNDIYINPASHGVVVAGWAYAVPIGGTIRAISAKYGSWYPPEVLDKGKSGSCTDIYLAAKCGLWLLGGRGVGPPVGSPASLVRLLNSCTLASPTRRLRGVDRVYDESRAILRGLYGERKFRPFAMPRSP